MTNPRFYYLIDNALHPCESDDGLPEQPWDCWPGETLEACASRHGYHPPVAVDQWVSIYELSDTPHADARGWNWLAVRHGREREWTSAVLATRFSHLLAFLQEALPNPHELFLEALIHRVATRVPLSKRKFRNERH